ncbi:MAG TPA: MFS transporter [Candidatus Limnocylindrales bacterium]|nr:MFS transporter [Candidatus Limnocylindrales bacterium]
MEAGTEPLARNRDFGILAITQGISAAGDAVSGTALPLLVLALTGSGFVMGVVGTIQTITDFAFGTVAGALADRGDRKAMMFGADAGRAILTAAIPLSVALGGPTMPVILVVAGPIAILRGVFRAGYLASLPNLVGRPLLARGTAILETVYSSAFIVGPSIAGLLATVIGPGETLAVDAASFGLSAAGLFLIHRDLRAPASAERSRIVDDIREGVAFVVHHPTLRSAVAVFALGNAVLAPMTAALTFRVIRDLGQPAAAFGLVLTVYGVGTLLGSLGATRLRPHTNVAVVLVLAFAAIGLGLIGAAAVSSLPIIAVLFAIAGMGEAVLVITYITVRAANSPDHLLGRIASTARVFALGVQPIGLLVAGALIDRIGGTATLALLGGAMLLASLAVVSARTLRETTVAPRVVPSLPFTEEPDPARLI